MYYHDTQYTCIIIHILYTYNHAHTHTHIYVLFITFRGQKRYFRFFFFLFRKISQHHNKISTNDSTTVFRISSIIKSRRNFVERAASNCAVPVAYDQLMLD